MSSRHLLDSGVRESIQWIRPRFGPLVNRRPRLRRHLEEHSRCDKRVGKIVFSGRAERADSAGALADRGRQATLPQETGHGFHRREVFPISAARAGTSAVDRRRVIAGAWRAACLARPTDLAFGPARLQPIARTPLSHSPKEGTVGTGLEARDRAEAAPVATMHPWEMPGPQFWRWE